MPTISIIVPVYNVEKYIDKCVKSILNQTFTDYELILVDDGSPDNCGAICEKYAAKDNRIVVIHKENGGLSSARNAGIDIAKGKYIGFVDSDDFIAEDMYEVLYNNMKRENADLSICGTYDYFSNNALNVTKKSSYQVMSNVKAAKMVLESKIQPSAGNKLYKRKIFKELRYPLHRLYEDAFIIINILTLCKKIVMTSDQKYYYVHRDNSITKSNFKEADFEIIEASERNYRLVKEHFPQIKNPNKSRIYIAHFFVLEKILMSGQEKENKGASKVIRFLRRNYIPIIKNKYINYKRKIALTVLLFNLPLYKKIVQYRKSLKRNNE